MARYGEFMLYSAFFLSFPDACTTNISRTVISQREKKKRKEKTAFVPRGSWLIRSMPKFILPPYPIDSKCLPLTPTASDQEPYSPKMTLSETIIENA